MTPDAAVKTIVITGASDGIGAAAARQLVADGHTVAVVGRSRAKTEAVAAQLDSDAFVADFARLQDVRRLAEELAARYPRIDVLANNAGGVFGDREPTEDGHELTFQVNHLAPFLLTTLLLPTLLESGASVIQTSSEAARLSSRLDLDDLATSQRYTAMRAYGNAKLANILFTRELHDRYHEQGLSTAAFHPGVIATNFASDTTSRLARWFYASSLGARLMGTPERGASQLVWFASGEPGVDWQSGLYYEKHRIAALPRQANDAALARGLWDRSTALLAPT